MNLLLQTTHSNLQAQIAVTGSKVKPTVFIVKALSFYITLANTSNSDDSEVMQKLIGNEEIVDIHHAGTACAFLLFLQ
jgi:3-phosphoshikimate 1-carboxyvinyltransferase